MSKRDLFAACLLAMMSASAFAAEIYRETDAQGRVVYSDRPASASASKLKVESRPADPEALEARRAAIAERQAKREESRARAAEVAERDRDIRAQRAQNCEKARAYRQRVETSHRLYTVDEQGERRYYSAAEHDAALEKARAQVEQWCDN